MYQHYFQSALRNLFKHSFFSIINILGLAVGIACCLLIVLFVQYELSFDKHFPKYDRIYRMQADFKLGKMEGKFPYMPAPLARTIEKDFPEIEQAGRLRTRGTYLVRKVSETENIKVNEVIFADQEFIEIFDFPFEQGDIESALSEPNTLIISSSLAEILFPDENAVGKSLTLDNDDTYKVTGVFKNTPDNSHFEFDMLLAMAGLEESKQNLWVSHNFITYFVLKEGNSIEAFKEKLFPLIIQKYVEPQIVQFMQKDLKEFEANGDRIKYGIQPLSAIHLTSNLEGELKPTSDIRYIWLFTGIALFILIIACINFMNLSTAKSANRAKEVGVRKVLGSFKSQLIQQFLVESFLLTLISFVLAILLAWAIMPFFNMLADRQIAIPFTNPLFYATLFSTLFIISVLAGIYPAFFLSSFRPATVLKGKIRGGASGKWLRSSLVIFQFTTSIVLIAATIAIYQQMRYVQNKKLGFEKDRVIIIEDTFTLRESLETFKKSLYDIPNVASVSASGYLPVAGFNRSNTMFWPEGDRSPEKQVLMQNWNVDDNYIPTLGLEVIAGRGFSASFPTDSQAIVLNRTAAYRFGFDSLENALGESISTFTDFPDGATEPTIGSLKVIGVVEDFHFESLRSAITALCLQFDHSTSAISVKVKTDEVAGVLSQIETKWKDFVPNQPFEYTFLDQRFANMYKSEQQLGQIFGAFSMLAILVACLGLFALAAFMAERRTKEIGIRKVLGASVSNIVGLLSREFMLLVILSLVIASPLAYILISQWLENFEYRINIGASIFILSGIAAITIAFLTVSYQSLRAAWIEPSKTLKDE